VDDIAADRAGADHAAPDATALDGAGLDRVGLEQATLDRTKVLAARYRAATSRPYLASALYALSLVPSTVVPTMAVDQWWRCYVNAEFVERTPVPELAGVWLHEVSHLLRDHHGRADRLPVQDQDDPVRVNLAQDCEINDDLAADGVRLPGGFIHPTLFGLPTGGFFEAYLPQIPRGQRLDAWPQCGSGAYGGIAPWDLPPGGAGRQVAQVSPTEAQAVRRMTAEAIRGHARTRGDVPAGWRRWADTVLEPVVDWRQVLAGSVRQAVAWSSGAVDYTYQRPGRRSASQSRVVLPSLRRRMPTVAIVVDTSGSMSDGDLSVAMAEIAGVLRGIGVRGNRVTVIACDAAVAITRRIARAEELEFAGGGGTDLRVGIEAALAEPPRPDVIVVLTDGETPWPAHPPSARVIAGLIGTSAVQPPDFVESIRIT
jgi:predicted metal-dependent peptidase